MKSIRLCSFISGALLIGHSQGFPQFRDTGSPLAQSSISSAVLNSAWLNINRIKIDLNNRGGLANPKFFSSAQFGGAFWPDTPNANSSNVIVFDAGPGVVGKLNGVPSMGLSQWGSSYSPGPVVNGQAAMIADPADSLRYRPYRIGRGDTPENNPDYKNWPVDLGAPVDGQGKPRLFGDQTVWSVFNNLDPNAPSPWWQSHMPLPGLPVEIQQTAYAHNAGLPDSAALLANVVFLEWTIINRGDSPVESTYVSLWTDIDFTDRSGNRPAIDTVNQIGYCWQAWDFPYEPPRAVGFVWLYGPTVPSTGSTAIFKGRPRSDSKNLPLSSFWGIQDDSYQDPSFYGPAYSMNTAWNIARGFDKVGNQIIDSVTHQVTRFPYSGDPVAATGWLCPSSSGGAGFNLFSGPFTLAPYDTQWVMAALVPSTASGRLECVTLLRQYAAALRSMRYGDFILTSTPGPKAILPSTEQLFQNYPNPFNPSTVLRYSLPGRSFVEMDVFSPLGQKVTTLVDRIEDAGIHEVTLDGSRLASGVYFYRLVAGTHAETKRLIVIR